MSIPFFEPLLRDDLAAVDQCLRESLSSDVVLIRQVAEYIIGSGGKRLRPALVVLAAHACHYSGRHHHTLAATIEMIHTATLLHDDVVDESALRRGHATANAMFGNAASVLIRQVAEYIIGSGGKRLRPALVVLAAHACRYSGRHHHTLAATIEMIHTATLLHDDVVDESALRRGHATANAMFGNAASVLVGDFLYSRAFQLMVSVDNMRVLRILSDATNVIAEGEVLQLLNAGNPDVGEHAYLDVIRRKTAKLFEAATQIGAIIGDADPATEHALARYGMHLGTAFQLIDDVLDYSGDHEAIGKNLGDDLADGKPTLPLIRAMQVGSAADAELIRDALRHGRLDDFRPVVEALARTDALDYAHAQAEAESKEAAEALSAIPDSGPRETLLKLAAFAVERTF